MTSSIHIKFSWVFSDILETTCYETTDGVGHDGQLHARPAQRLSLATPTVIQKCLMKELSRSELQVFREWRLIDLNSLQSNQKA